MKGFLKNNILRGLAALIVGLLLIVFAADVTRWIVALCGLLFIIPGAVAIIVYLRTKAELKQSAFYPVVSAGCILFGLVLVVWPSLFVDIFVYILAALLAFVSISQFYTLWTIKSVGIIHPLIYAVPLAELAIAMYVFVIPASELIAIPAVVIGTGLILYSLLEMLLKIVARKRQDEIADPTKNGHKV